ncbi:MAG TPA: inosine/xanthosine triphosphatase [Patescibacteria group bacterium]|nr:inosine/xanthosine triphosphatase [Patescibacteria group bacterium]
MLVVLGSLNNPKLISVKKAFSKSFHEDLIKFKSISVNNGVSDHPVNGSESIQGAINRAKSARKQVPKADYYVGIEGGLLNIDNRYWEFGWVAIIDKIGEINTGLSAGIELKGKLLQDVLNGIELSQAINKHFGLKELGKAKGFYGLATDDLITRVDAYENAIIFALAPFLNKKYFS